MRLGSSQPARDVATGAGPSASPAGERPCGEVPPPPLHFGLGQAARDEARQDGGPQPLQAPDHVRRAGLSHPLLFEGDEEPVDQGSDPFRNLAGLGRLQDPQLLECEQGRANPRHAFLRGAVRLGSPRQSALDLDQRRRQGLGHVPQGHLTKRHGVEDNAAGRPPPAPLPGRVPRDGGRPVHEVVEPIVVLGDGSLGEDQQRAPALGHEARRARQRLPVLALPVNTEHPEAGEDKGQKPAPPPGRGASSP